MSSRKATLAVLALLGAPLPAIAQDTIAGHTSRAAAPADPTALPAALRAIHDPLRQIPLIDAGARLSPRAAAKLTIGSTDETLKDLVHRATGQV